MSLRIEPSTDIARLVALLRDADEGEARIAAVAADPANTSYLALDDAACVGAVVMRWQPDESEILLIAMDAARRGRGYGKACIEQIRQEAVRRRVGSLIVGTANTSLDNIAFYQKCGFRMDSIRRDYFDYLPRPMYENGILTRDMLVLRMALDG